MKTKVSNDEFYLTCTEWRKCNENGRCIKCGSIVKKKLPQSYIRSYDEYRQDNFDRDVNNEFDGDNE